MAMIRSLAIVGAMGGFGRAFTERAKSSGLEVVAIDADPRADIVCDVVQDATPLRNVLDRVDALLLCVAEPVAIACLEALDGHTPEDLLIVDICSVKSNVSAVAERCCVSSEYLSIHPMFGPERGFTGNNLVAIDIRSHTLCAAFISLLKSWGVALVQTDAVTHDKVTSIVQVLTHATLLTFVNAQNNLSSRIDAPAELIEAMATPIYTELESVAQGMLRENPELYHNIQTAGPWGEMVREALVISAQTIADQISPTDAKQFSELFQQLASRDRD